MEKFFPILKQCPLFAHIAESDLSAMLHCLQVTVQHYDKGQIVIHEGEKAERFGIVLTGAVQLWRIDYSGNRSIMATGALWQTWSLHKFSANPLSVQKWNRSPYRQWHLRPAT